MMVAYLRWIRQLCDQQRSRVKGERKSNSDCKQSCQVMTVVRKGFEHRVLIPLAAINMPIEVDADCRAVPASMITAPMNSVGRRPRLSDASGENGSPTREPMTCAALMRPVNE